MSWNILLSMPVGLASLRVFGSRFRGDSDDCSDLDVLAVVDSNRVHLNAQKVELEIQSAIGEKASVSWYSKKRIHELFSRGHLFAWHLHLQSCSIVAHSKDYVDSLGKPEPYGAAVEDIAGLAEILSTIPAALAACPSNVTYEAGVLFVCLRNIAMCASWFSKPGVNFSRHSPFVLRELGTIRFPLVQDEYDLLVASRLASQRGTRATPMEAETVMSFCSRVQPWVDSVQSVVRRRSAL